MLCRFFKEIEVFTAFTVQAPHTVPFRQDDIHAVF